ncbi:MAG: 23S rRNA (pseudouridine(1915)-N(3))-methyltransferase RlmH [Acholeplasmatales bacterium]|nr:MAG: 23S rRNA (pseudouridine(1915)-N(3))-methyltransferase RlmH [Acholeplasmatales bacterium]
MTVDLIVVGNLKERYLLEAQREYLKRLQRYGSVRVIEVKEARESKQTSEADIQKLLDEEAQSIREKLQPNTFRIGLVVEGKQLDSVAFSEKIESILTYQSSHLTFIIGGSHGLSSDFKKELNFRLSFSEMTFPHQLMRIIFLEQLYRAMRIRYNEPYHK